MTETAAWLVQQRRRLVSRFVAGNALATIGIAAVIVGLGLAMARAGVYRHAPILVVVVWLGLGASVGVGCWLLVRRLRSLAVPALARAVERGGKTRSGWVQGAAAMEDLTGGGLGALADRQVTAWLAEAGPEALRATSRHANRSAAAGTIALAAGVVALAVAGPTSQHGRDFWRPVEVVRRAAGPIDLTVDAAQVARGASVRVRIRAPGRPEVQLEVRAPGETWDASPVALDGDGAAVVTLGPLLADRFVRAVSGDRVSQTVHVQVTLPLLLSTLELRARFPDYTERPDEILSAESDTVWLPVGTELSARGQATVPLGGVVFRSMSDTVPLAVAERTFEGAVRVTRTATWTLAAWPQIGGDSLSDAPTLTVIAVSDSVPVIQVPVPGTDTTAPLTLRQGLLIDARDDYRIRRVEVESWRVSRRGDTSAHRADSLPVPDAGVPRLFLTWTLDLNDRGFVPGDTAFYRVRAVDNAPRPNVGVSRTFALRLPSMSELRRAMREASQAAQRDADSIASAQRDLARRVEDLAAERQRSAETGARDDAQLPFESVERAREIVEEERAVTARAEELGQQLRELSEAAWNAGLTDPAFHEQLRELQDLLQRAISDDLLESLAALQEALDRLSPEAVQSALQQLADAADRLREQLERGRELFQRAAVEGELTTLAAESEDLARRETEWAARVEQIDSLQAAREELALADETGALRSDMEAAASFVDSIGMSAAPIADAADATAEAESLMRRAASESRAARSGEAQESGRRASGALQQASEMLERARDGMRDSWRAEVLSEMDRALVEVAELARREERLSERLLRGEAGPDVRGEQGAVREGVERVAERLRTAAGKNALVPPQLGNSLGLAQQQMDDALAAVQRAQPIPSDAAAAAGAAVDALNAAAYAIVRSRDDVAGSGSGSGLSEALERMARAAQEQGAMNGEAGGLLPMMQAGAGQLRQQLMALAARQEALAQELERIQAESDLSGVGELAEEASRLASELEGGRLDQNVLDRQEQLFRRLLDAGRSLESEELDQRRERVSETARIRDDVRTPTDAVRSDATRYPYPTWDELRDLTPDERRMIAEYFRRLNDASR